MSVFKSVDNSMFFLKEFDDGIIVAFKRNDDNVSCADKIHDFVVNNYDSVFYTSDIINGINCSNYLKEILNDSLFVHYGDGISIKACNLHTCFINRDSSEVYYGIEKILLINNRREKKRYIGLGILTLICLLIGVIAIFLFYKHSDSSDCSMTNDSLKTEINNYTEIDTSRNQVFANDTILKILIDEEIDTDHEFFDETFDSISLDNSEMIEKSNYTEENENVLITKEDKNNDFDIDIQRVIIPYVEDITIDEDREKELEIEMAKELLEQQIRNQIDDFLKIADAAFFAFGNTLEETKAIESLNYYKNALDIAGSNNISLSVDMKAIKQRIQILEKELK